MQTTTSYSEVLSEHRSNGHSVVASWIVVALVFLAIAILV